jgi:purine-cytosine permease-like protein
VQGNGGNSRTYPFQRLLSFQHTDFLYTSFLWKVILMSQEEKQPQENRAWTIESHGIEPIGDEERHGNPSEVFWIWFAANVGILGVTYGGMLAANGLNLWQSILVAFLAPVVSFAVVGVLSIAGIWSGAPMLTLSRAMFGPRGNIGPALTSWISLVGWETVIVITSSYALLELFKIVGLPVNPVTTIISLIIVAAIVIMLGLWGHATLVQVQKIATWVFGILTLIIVVFLLFQTDWQKVLSTPPGPWDTGLITSFIVIMASTGFGWINSGADYTRYMPRKTSGSAITFWSVFGGTLPLLVLMIVGVLLASKAPNLANGSPVDLIGLLPSWMAVPYLITAIGGMIPAAALDIYSSGLNLLAVGIKIKRYYAVLIDGILMVAGAFYVMLIANDFQGPFISFVSLLAAGLTTWAAIVLVDMISRRRYDTRSLVDTTPKSAYYFTGGFYLPACIAWVVGVVIAFLFTKSSFFTGPFAIGIFESTNLGYMLGAVVSAVLYAMLKLTFPIKASVPEEAVS